MIPLSTIFMEDNVSELPVYQEKDFIIDLNEDSGLLTFGIKEKQGEVIDPKIVYDGKDHALLYRNPEQIILLDYINDELKDRLFNAERVMISEFNIDNPETPLKAYSAEVEKTDKVSFSEIGFESYESLVENLEKVGNAVLDSI